MTLLVLSVNVRSIQTPKLVMRRDIMPKAFFYKLERPEKARHLCEFAEQYHQEGRRVLVTVVDENQGVTLDRFMWSWQKGSFIPHAYDNGAVECHDEPVVIGSCERNPNGASVLILGGSCSFEFVRSFDVVIDFAEVYDDELAAASRQRYSRYRQAGFEMTYLNGKETGKSIPPATSAGKGGR